MAPTYTRAVTNLAFVLPADDAAAVQLAGWGDELRQTASSHAAVADLTGVANVIRTNVDNLVSAADHLLWFGHGREDALVSGTAAIVDASNVGALLGGVVVAMACKAAISLGPQAVTTAGVDSFLGFDDEIGWPVMAASPTRDAFVQGLHCLFTQGHDVSSAAHQLRKYFHVARQSYESQGAAFGLIASEAQTAWLFAKSNAGSVRVLGSGSATLI
jgi:hypothetical protein